LESYFLSSRLGGRGEVAGGQGAGAEGGFAAPWLGPPEARLSLVLKEGACRYELVTMMERAEVRFDRISGRPTMRRPRGGGVRHPSDATSSCGAAL